jgi:hypothetical protein
MVSVSLAGCSHSQFKDICLLSESNIPFGKTIGVRAIVAPAGGGYLQLLTGKDCLGTLSFRIDGGLPPALEEQILLSLRETERHRASHVVQADMTVELHKTDFGGSKLGHTVAGAVQIKNAEDFRLVEVNFLATPN